MRRTISAAVVLVVSIFLSSGAQIDDIQQRWVRTRQFAYPSSVSQAMSNPRGEPPRGLLRVKEGRRARLGSFGRWAMIYRPCSWIVAPCRRTPFSACGRLHLQTRRQGWKLQTGLHSSMALILCSRHRVFCTFFCFVCCFFLKE